MSSYGAADDTVAEKSDDKTWEYRGYPWRLMLDVGILFGRQYLMLISIVVTIFASRDYLMSCNPKETSTLTAVLCEYTKAHIRCFPLLALVVSLFASSRVYLFLRVYYRLLKRRVLIDFDTFPPYRDPLFKVMAFCLSQATCHFILNAATYYSMSLSAKGMSNTVNTAKDKEFQRWVYAFSLFYMVPSVLFFVLFYNAYDIAELTVPFSKYFEGDNEGSLLDAKELTIIAELTAMNVVNTDMLAEVCAEGPCTADSVYAKFVAQSLNENKKEHRIKSLSEWRLAATWWPAKLILDPRITGPESAAFRRSWYFFSVPLTCLMIFTAWYNAWVIKDKWDDVVSGQREDIAGIVVGLAIFMLIVRISYDFAKKTIWLPLTGYDFEPFRRRLTAPPRMSQVS